MAKVKLSYDVPRVCGECASSTTYMYDKHNSGVLEPDWRYIRDEAGNITRILCKNCHSRLIHNPKYNPDRHKKYNPRRVMFRAKYVILKQTPRIGVCNFCRAVVPFDVKKTGMHHFSYDPRDPLRDAIEICQRCHRDWHWEHDRAKLVASLTAANRRRRRNV